VFEAVYLLTTDAGTRGGALDRREVLARHGLDPIEEYDESYALGPLRSESREPDSGQRDEEESRHSVTSDHLVLATTGKG
jgi:hypothetical protein